MWFVVKSLFRHNNTPVHNEWENCSTYDADHVHNIRHADFHPDFVVHICKKNTVNAILKINIKLIFLFIVDL